MEEDAQDYFEVQKVFATDEEEMNQTTANQDDLTKMDPKVVDLVKKELMSIHVNMNHMGLNAMRAYLTRKGAQPWVIALAGQLKCSICEATARREPMPAASGREAEPLD
eukprot:6150489-Pyramimonas_sp.AAC.1